MTPFDHIKNLHNKKKHWEDFNVKEKYPSLNKTTLINRIKASPNIMEINGLGQQYYGINPSLDKALLDKGYNPKILVSLTSNQNDIRKILKKQNIILDLALFDPMEYYQSHFSKYIYHLYQKFFF